MPKERRKAPFMGNAAARHYRCIEMRPIAGALGAAVYAWQRLAPGKQPA